jgi:serine protease Do
MLQTDAAVKPGNSGGAILESSGAVVGLVESKNTQAEGFGFAVSSATAAPLMASWRAAPQHAPAASCDAPLGPQTGAAVTPTLPPDVGDVGAELGTTLATYFDGINDGDYASAYYSETARSHDGESLGTFTANVVTSYDTDVNVSSVTPDADGAYEVFVTFTSVQAANEGPNGDTCDLWSLDYRLVPGGSGFLIDAASSATGGPAYHSCAG